MGLAYLFIWQLHYEMNGLTEYSSRQILEATKTMQRARMKKEVAPMVCTVQFISPPSEIVAVDTHRAIQEAMESQPNLTTLGSSCPVNSKLLMVRQFLSSLNEYLRSWKVIARMTGATIMPMRKMRYYGQWMAVWVMSVCGKGLTSGGDLLTATQQVHMMLPRPTMKPRRGKARPLKPQYPFFPPLRLVFNSLRSMLLSSCIYIIDQLFIYNNSHSNGRYVCAEDSGKQPLIANRMAAQQWKPLK